MQSKDAEIRRAVHNALEWAPDVEDGGVVVRVISGVVTLFGSATSGASRVAAERAAQRVTGVRAVTNHIAVDRPASAAPTDDDLAAAVRRALDWDAFVDETRILAEVHAGRVTLTGDVDYAIDWEHAERCARRIRGIRDVTNDLVVIAPEMPRLTASAAP